MEYLKDPTDTGEQDQVTGFRGYSLHNNIHHFLLSVLSSGINHSHF